MQLNRQAEDARWQASVWLLARIGLAAARRTPRTWGIDWLMLETQHGSWGNDGAIAGLVAITGGTAVLGTRVAKNDYFLTTNDFSFSRLAVTLASCSAAPTAAYPSSASSTVGV